MDEQLQKATVTRSYSRKVNLGNFNMADVFESRTEIMPTDSTLLDFYHKSEDLHAQVMADVERDVAELLAKNKVDDDSGDWEAFKRCLDATSRFSANSAEDFQKLSPFQSDILNSVKKAYKRSPEFLEKKSLSSVENEGNREK